MPELAWCYLGRVGYAEARHLQARLALERSLGHGCDVLLLLEHSPILTLGRHARRQITDVERPDIPVVRTDRGGSITYHGPGQLVGYPVVALRSAGRGVRSLVASIERAMCDTAGAFQVAAFTRPGLPGIWAGHADAPVKLGSIGLAVRRGVSLHGCALNVARRAESGFVGIEPCGLADVAMSSLESEGSRPVPSLCEVAPVLAAALAARLRCDGTVRIQVPGAIPARLEARDNE